MCSISSSSYPNPKKYERLIGADMVLDTPVEFSTILPENKLIGKKHKTPPIRIKETTKVNIALFKMNLFIQR